MSQVRLESPYIRDAGAFWLRGNLHTHTNKSDGSLSPQEMVARYAALGHDFLGLSDHDVFFDPSGLDPCGMVLLSGTEISGGPHILDVGARKLVNPGGEAQDLVDAILRESGFPVFCHPNWTADFNHCPYEVLAATKDYVGVEIYNGSVLDEPGDHLALDKWDRLLSAGRRVWGYANDDAHRPEKAGRGWNVVRVRQATPQAVLEALRNGSFYASCGVEVRTIACDGPILHVEAPNADKIALVGEHGARFHIADGPVLRYDAAQAPGPFVRVECYGRGLAAAWTQPIYVYGGLYDQRREKLARLGAMEKPLLRAYRAERAPRMTGTLDDPLWGPAEALDRFMRLQDGEAPPVRTEVRCILAEGTLFFGIRCEEPLLDQLKLNVPADGRANIWTDESMELFLDVEGQAAGYYHLMVSAAGFACGLWRGAGRRAVPPLRAAAGRWSAGQSGGWCVELAVGIGPVDLSPSSGTRWGFHACRNRFPVRGTFVSSWVGGSNHNPSQYGLLLL